MTVFEYRGTTFIRIFVFRDGRFISSYVRTILWSILDDGRAIFAMKTFDAAIETFPWEFQIGKQSVHPAASSNV